MPRRRVGQLGFGDAAASRRGNGGVDSLAEIDRLVDWAPLERLLDPVHRSARGEASYPPLVMFKALLLQKWHGLSDPGLEAALSDRLSFMRFCGFTLEDRTPDHTTIWRFREALSDGLIELCMAELGRQLDAAGVVLKTGTLIDASLVTSAARRPRVDEDKVSPVDPEARFGAGNDRGRFAFGYKVHVAVDHGSGLVGAIEVTPANVQEVAVAPALVEAAGHGTVYADRGYDSDGLRAELAARGLGDGLMRRRKSGGRQASLPPDILARNHDLSLVRRAVESVFGTMKRTYRLGRMRAFTQARNRVDVTLFAMAFNLRRWRTLAAAAP